MSPLLLIVLWVHLAACVLLTGGFFAVLLGGLPHVPVARRWNERVVGWASALVLVALGSGMAWLLGRTALFENRPHAALELRAVWHAALDTWPGFVWLTRQGILIVLGVFLAMRPDVTERRNWIAARGEALLLAALALVLVSATSHAAATSPGAASAAAIDAAHLLGTGLWVGALAPLALLLASASQGGREDALYAVTATRRFSRAALVVVLVLIGSGVMNTILQVGSIAGLLGTTHGRLLLAKLAVLVPILALAAANRRYLLPAASATGDKRALLRRLAAFVGAEAGLAIVLLALAAAMTLTTPARHGDPTWPLPFRLSLDASLAPATKWRATLGSQVALIGLVALFASFLVRRRRAPMLIGALGLFAVGAGVGLPPLVVHAYPTTYRRPLVTYNASSIAAGMAIYHERCVSCHSAADAPTGPVVHPPVDLRVPPASRRLAGDLFWLVTHGSPHGMPKFGDRLDDTQRWNLINFIKALGAANDSGRIGRQVDLPAWLVAPDFTISVGPLLPGALRDYRGRRMVLLVLYTLPESRARMEELARSYPSLSVLGVEVIAVPTEDASGAIRQLGSSPPVLYPVVTAANTDIVGTYGLFAPGSHAEVLIDRQGYIRAIWREGAGMPGAAEVQSQVERLNEEKSPPPFPDDHVH